MTLFFPLNSNIHHLSLILIISLSHNFQLSLVFYYKENKNKLSYNKTADKNTTI